MVDTLMTWMWATRKGRCPPRRAPNGIAAETYLSFHLAVGPRWRDAAES